MPTSNRDFQLGLLPEKKWNWRTFVASYGIVSGLILFLILFGIIMPDTLLITANYHVTELIPRPALRPERLPKSKPLPVHAKLLPAILGSGKVEMMNMTGLERWTKERVVGAAVV